MHIKGEADAISIASVAARDKAPIILTNGQS
ncbi:cell wall-binding repeat-containing protein, partial [Clostridioides difficile]